MCAAMNPGKEDDVAVAQHTWIAIAIVLPVT